MTAHPKAVIKAGGTDLLIRMRREELDHDLVVNLRRVPGIRGVTLCREAGLAIGSYTTIDELAANHSVSAWNAVADAADLMATPQVRNLATVGGNVCNRSPVADVAASLVAYEAMASVESPGGQELVPVEEWVKGPPRVPFILKEIRLPPLQSRTVGSFLKSTRTRGDGLAIVSCALVLTVHENAFRCARVRIVFGGVAPFLIRARRVEDALASGEIKEESIERACALVEKDIRPIDDFRASAEYRVHLARVLLRRCWSRAVECLGLVTVGQASRLS